LIFWVFYAFTPPENDEARYRDMQHASRLFARALSVEKSRFGAIMRPLHLSGRYVRRFETQREALLASGYLTNISVNVSNATGRRGPLVKQLDTVTRGTDILICELSWRSNIVAVTCRPQDEARLRYALAK
jgi:hypothetical protein